MVFVPIGGGMGVAESAHMAGTTMIGKPKARNVGMLVLAWLALAPTVDAGLAGRPAEGEAVETCAARATRAVSGHLARSLACSARARLGGTSSRCESRSATKLAAGLGRAGTACLRDAETVARAVDGCVAAALAELPGEGRCGVRKLMLASAAVSPIGRALGVFGRPARSTKTAVGLRERLCRKVERAGACPGTCLRLAGVLAQCWETMPITRPPRCDLPKPGARDRVVLVGVHEGSAVSTATVVGQDEETTTTRVVIEPGSEPLYLVLSSFESVVWRFEGDTARVSRVVLAGVRRHGVAGVAAERVTDLSRPVAFLSEASCFVPFTDVPSGEADTARAVVEERLGRPVHVVAGYEPATVTLPAGIVADEPDSDGPVPPGFAPQEYDTALDFSPGGVVDVDPAVIAASVPADSYEVLPHYFGLAQLIATGVVTVEQDTYVIARPMPRFPAGLTGGRLARFLLAAGVPMPAGDPGHSCVLSDETGLPLTESSSCGPLPPSDAAACGLPPASADARVLLIGVGGGDAIPTATVAGQDVTTTAGRIVVEPGLDRLYVVLSGGYPTIWRFEGATERITQAVLVGGIEQGIAGLSPEQVTDLSQRAPSSFEVRCFQTFWQPRSLEALMARRFVERALGRGVDVFASLAERGTVSLPAATVTPTEPDATVPAGLDPLVFQYALRSAPGSVVDVDPAAVESASTVERYQVLPEWMGLAELVGAGSLELRDGAFLIRDAIPRFPAGLTGAISVQFVLATGVPMPPGDPGHSCVVAESTGALLAGLCSGPRPPFPPFQPPPS